MNRGVILHPRPALPDWVARAALSVLEDAYHRRGPFAEVPPGALDCAVRAMAPPSGLTLEEVRRICFEERNALDALFGVEPHPAMDAVWNYVQRRSPMLVPDEGEERYFRLNRKSAERHLRALRAGGETFEDVEISTEAGLYIKSHHEVGPVSVRMAVWAPYKPAPVIQSHVAFHLDDGDQLVALHPAAALMDGGIAWFEREFDHNLLREFGYARLVRNATLAALRREMLVH